MSNDVVLGWIEGNRDMLVRIDGIVRHSDGIWELHFRAITPRIGEVAEWGGQGFPINTTTSIQVEVKVFMGDKDGGHEVDAGAAAEFGEFVNSAYLEGAEMKWGEAWGHLPDYKKRVISGTVDMTRSLP